MAATFTTGKTFTQPSSNNTATDLNNAVNLATVANIGSGNGEIAADAIESGATYKGVVGTAAAATPALRKLGTGANDALAGNGVPTAASGLKFGANAVIPLSATNPIANTFLQYDGTNIVGATPSSSSATTGTGTVTTAAASPNVVGVGTKFLTELRVGYLLTINSVTWRVVTITDNLNVVVNANWGAINAGVAYTYAAVPTLRAWNDQTAKSAVFSVAATDVGQLFVCDKSGGSYAATLCAASSFGKGDNVAFMVKTDDSNSVTITCAGADTFTDGSTTLVLTTIGASATLVSDGVSVWGVVSKTRLNGEVIQKNRTETATKQTVTAHIASTVAMTTGNSTKINLLDTSIAPKSVVSRIHITGKVTGAGSGAGQLVCIGVFSGATLIDVVIAEVPQGGKGFTVPLDCIYTSGSLAAATISVYAALTAGSFFHLGSETGATLYGGNVHSCVDVAEECV